MAYPVIILSRTASKNVDAYNSSAVYSTADVPNGTPFTLGALSTTQGEKEVFTVTKATNASKDVWLAYSPEVNRMIDNCLTIDPRLFVNKKDLVFDIFRVQAGDIIQVSIDLFAQSKDPETVTGATVVELNTSGEYEAKVSATGSYAGLSFDILGIKPITIANGKVMGGEQVKAWLLRCKQNNM